MSEGLWSLAAGIFVIVVVYMLVRPGSVASQAVTDVGSALKNIVTAAVS